VNSGTKWPEPNNAVNKTSGERVERRRHTRYDLSATVAFVWKNRGGSRHQGEGFTRDLSEGGMFIFTDNAPPVGTLLRVDLFFPPLKTGSILQVKSKCEVMRVEPSEPGEARGGFAVLSKSFVLRNSQTGSSGTMGGTGKPN
jgi:hypothetical protein